jgi:hypothetical protein
MMMKTTLIAAAAGLGLMGLNAVAVAAPLGGSTTDIGAALKADAKVGSATENVRWVCNRWGRCAWVRPQVLSFYVGPRYRHHHGFRRY